MIPRPTSVTWGAPPRVNPPLGRPDGADKYFHQALELSRKLGDIQGEISARANLASVHAAQQRPLDALNALAEAVAISHEIGDLKSECRLRYNIGLLLASQNRWEESQKYFEASRSLATSLNWREGLALAIDQLQRVQRNLA